MIRKHIKVEPRRYYYHCDRRGMIVWQDHVSGGLGQAWPESTRLNPNPVDANRPADQHKQFVLELNRMITRLGSHPSIANCWPFNKRYGQHRTKIKVGGKYVHLGTPWSTDLGRKSSCNLYACVADKITGPYRSRQFAGRFLGHRTRFTDKTGKSWCTAVFNTNVPPVPRNGIELRDLGENTQTINEQGVTIVSLDVRVFEDGNVDIRAKAPVYAPPRAR